MRDISESPKGAPKASWFRRAVTGTAFAVVGLLTLGAATPAAQAGWYGYGYHPYYVYYHPHYYGYGYGYPSYVGWGWGWHGGWGGHRGWRHW